MDKNQIIIIMKKYLPYIDEAVLDTIAQEIQTLGCHEPALPHFLSSLTTLEQKALDILLKLINYSEGTISISKLIEESQISRAVITNLIIKIEKDSVMEVKSKGVKGTYFKLLIDSNELKKKTKTDWSYFFCIFLKN